MLYCMGQIKYQIHKKFNIIHIPPPNPSETCINRDSMSMYEVSKSKH